MAKFAGIEIVISLATISIMNRESTSEVCGALCVAEPQCTHFTHNNGICYLKRNTASWYEQNAYEMVCGFVVGRSKRSVGVRYFYFY